MTTMPVHRGNETYFTTQEACDFLGVSRQTLNRLVKKGRLRQNRMGVTRTVYYRQSELEQIATIEPIDEDEEEQDRQ
jgi:excisionase family DNA binding protein